MQWWCKKCAVLKQSCTSAMLFEAMPEASARSKFPLWNALHQVFWKKPSFHRLWMTMLLKQALSSYYEERDFHLKNTKLIHAIVIHKKSAIPRNIIYICLHKISNTIHMPKSFGKICSRLWNNQVLQWYPSAPGVAMKSFTIGDI